MEEIWINTVGFEGYQVSNTGKVKSLDRVLVQKNGSKHSFKGKILKPCPDKYGYLRVNLYSNHCKKKFIPIHRLVAEAFIPNPNNYQQINHKSEDKTDNSVGNLEWCDAAYNTTFGTRNERISASNINNPNYSKWVIKLNKDNEILHFYQSAKQAQRETGISAVSIYRVCNHKAHTAGGYVWKYAE